MGLLGLDLVDLSAGGIRARVGEPIAAGEQIRLVLRLDNGQPLTPVVDVLIGGQLAQGRFCPMPEVERRRIVQFVYRQELAERQRAEAAAPAD
jgi:c-di-GMP-binding flagellar brake protein YcgR